MKKDQKFTYHLTLDVSKQSRLNVDKVLSCITRLLEIDPDHLGKHESIRLITKLISELAYCKSVQVLEVLKSDSLGTTFLRYFPEKVRPEEFVATSGINRYCVINHRFFLASSLDDKTRLATGESGEISGEMCLREETMPYILTSSNQKEDKILFYPLIRSGECIGTIKLFDFQDQDKFTSDDLLLFRPIADAIANLLHLYAVIDNLDKKNQEYDTLMAQSSEAISKLQIGERLTYQFFAATSHLHELAGLLGGMASDRQEFLSVIHFSKLSNKEKDNLVEILGRYEQHRAEAFKKVRELLRDRPVEEKLNIKLHNIKDLVNEQLEIYENQLEAKGIRLKKSLKNADVLASVDASAFKYVIRILINNAIRALEDGNNRPKILGVYANEGGGQLVIKITDNGIGIDPKYQKKIFEAFFTTKKDGSGIGLWWAKRTVEEEHQGKLTLERSYPNNGSIFLITLPT